MKPLKSLLKSTLVLIMGAALFASCAKETAIPQPGNTEEITFTIETPAPAAVKTRIATEQENAIDNLYLFAFNSSDELVKTLTASKSAGTLTEVTAGATNKNRYTFTGTLTPGTYSVMVVSNVTITGYNIGDLRSDVEELVSVVTEPNKWDLSTRKIPMWGEVTSFNTVSPSLIEMRRMLARIHVNIDNTPHTETGIIAKDVFHLTSVSYANYNTKGMVIPAPTSFTGTVYTSPTLPLDPPAGVGPGTQTGLYLNYTPTDVTKSENQIYVFESAHVAKYGNANWQNNPCIIIGGIYDANGDGIFTNDGSPTYYRLDFIKGNPSDPWLSVLRNHSYNFTITQVKGAGFGSENEALNSTPMNMEAQVIDWNDQNMNEGQWNGTYELYLSGSTAHFQQDGTPTNQEFFIKTNLPSLTLEQFTSDPSSDGAWYSKPGQIWTNDHFTVIYSQLPDDNGYKVYKLVVSSNAVAIGDPARENWFRIKGSNLSAKFNITQQEYATIYHLTSTTNKNQSLDGTDRRIEINVASTHDYKVVFNTASSAMLKGVYLNPTTGSNLIIDPATDPQTTTIDASVTSLWVELASFTGSGSRQDTFTIEQTEASSDAPALLFTIEQSALQLTATRRATPADPIAVTGNNVNIDVVSNITWVPEVTMDGAPVPYVSYTDVTTSVTGNRTVQLIIDANTTVEQRVFEIVFNGTGIYSSITTTPITVTQAAVTKSITLTRNDAGGSIAAIGGTVALRVDANIAWEVESLVIGGTPITSGFGTYLTPASGSAGNNQSVTLNPGNNTSISNRTITLKLKGQSPNGTTLSSELSVTQLADARSIEITRTGSTGDIAAIGGNATFSVESNITWQIAVLQIGTTTISEGDYGIYLNTLTGPAGTTASVTLTPGDNGVDRRTITITLKGRTGNEGVVSNTLTFNQAAIPKSIVATKTAPTGNIANTAGSTATISVVANIAWEIDELTVGGTAIASTAYSTYLSATSGSGGTTPTPITLTMGANSASSTRDITLILKGTGSNASVTSTLLTMTQNGLPGGTGGGGTPGAGSTASEWILSVSTDGVLHLDGQSYSGSGAAGNIVYFRWGSLIAMSGNTGNYDGLKTVAWYPIGFTNTTLLTNWANVPHTDSGTIIGTVNASAGTGDPCRLASKGGTGVGNYKMPTGHPYNTGTAFTTANTTWRASPAGRTGPDGVFYPAAGDRTSSSGALANLGSGGRYWSERGLTASNASCFYFYSYSVEVGNSSLKAAAFPIRCVPAN